MKYLAILAFVALFYACNCEVCFNTTTQNCIKGKLEKLTAEQKQGIKDKTVKCCGNNKEEKRIGCIIEQFKETEIFHCVKGKPVGCLIGKFRDNEIIKKFVNAYKNADNCDTVYEQIKEKINKVCSEYEGDDKDVEFMCECKNMFYQ
ncbi:uncharacterized protein [Centruroides vittatus]|uniref:uncharacterized protein n=1 Tax=Centruroides vittatus TaxID=120091 RepID=UPI00350F92A6